MRAIAISSYGDDSHLTAQQLPDPERPDGFDLLIRVKACSVNPVDIKVRNGTYDVST